ncbi:MAG: hypothetical protein GWO24_35280, partial [Akkermansiaceae bacterium]|nr:hypothetical protein [Akkermansiaceae bacterium]
VVTFRENLEALADLTVEVSGDLITWSSDPAMTELVSRVDNGDGTATVTVRMSERIDPGQRQFFVRLRAD